MIHLASEKELIRFVLLIPQSNSAQYPPKMCFELKSELYGSVLAFCFLHIYANYMNPGNANLSRLYE